MGAIDTNYPWYGGTVVYKKYICCSVYPPLWVKYGLEWIKKPNFDLLERKSYQGMQKKMLSQLAYSTI